MPRGGRAAGRPGDYNQYYAMELINLIIKEFHRAYLYNDPDWMKQILDDVVQGLPDTIMPQAQKELTRLNYNMEQYDRWVDTLRGRTLSDKLKMKSSQHMRLILQSKRVIIHLMDEAGLLVTPYRGIEGVEI